MGVLRYDTRVDKDNTPDCWPGKAFPVLLRMLGEPRTPDALSDGLTNPSNRLAWLENRAIISYDLDTKLWYLRDWVYRHPLVEKHPDGLFGLSDAGVREASIAIESVKKSRGRSVGKEISTVGLNYKKKS